MNGQDASHPAAEQPAPEQPAAEQAVFGQKDWITKVLGETTSHQTAHHHAPLNGPFLSGPGDLKISDPFQPATTHDAVASDSTAPTPVSSDAWTADDWVAGLTGGPVQSQRPAPTPAPVALTTTNAWGETVPLDPQPYAYQGAYNPYSTREDVAQKKLVAGLLAIFLGSLGIHKFYLGQNRAGFIMLALALGAWPVAFFLSIVTLGTGWLLACAAALLVTVALGGLGVVEGITYLTRSDADFAREVLKRPTALF